MAPQIVIVGLPSSGKTTAAAELASRLGPGATLGETDAAVEQALGMPPSEIFLVKGEQAFREAEIVAVERGLASDLTVLVLGSGAVESDEVRAALADHFVVWLKIAGPEAAKRSGITGARPVQLGNIRSQWSRLAAQREPHYAEVADLIVDSGKKDAAACAQEILDAVASKNTEPKSQNEE